jgi:hypothetical protein
MNLIQMFFSAFVWISTFTTKKILYQGILLLAFLVSSCKHEKNAREFQETWCVSESNTHLFETASGKPYFVNSCTVWLLIEEGDWALVLK